MFIHAHRARHVPRWYLRLVIRSVNRYAEANPGFHRLVVSIGMTGVKECPFLVNPDCEPGVRRLLARVLVLAPPVEDDEPWPSL